MDSHYHCHYDQLQIFHCSCCYGSVTVVPQCHSSSVRIVVTMDQRLPACSCIVSGAGLWLSTMWLIHTAVCSNITLYSLHQPLHQEISFLEHLLLYHWHYKASNVLSVVVPQRTTEHHQSQKRIHKHPRQTELTPHSLSVRQVLIQRKILNLPLISPMSYSYFLFPDKIVS